MGEAGNWCLIESDPAVFTELIRDFGNFIVFGGFAFDDDCQVLHFMFHRLIGVAGLQVEELWSLDADEFKNLG